MMETGVLLETDNIILRPLVVPDYRSFLELTEQETENTWEYFSSNLSDPAQLQRWVQTAVEEKTAGKRLPFTIVDKASACVAGSSSIGNIAAYDKRVEIGWSWLGAAFRSSGMNRHAKFCLMCYAFEEMGMERVEFKTGVNNTRARRGLEKIGGTEEGILRSHSLLWNGSRRTSVFYSVLRHEWQNLKTTIFADIAGTFKRSADISN